MERPSVNRNHSRDRKRQFRGERRNGEGSGVLSHLTLNQHGHVHEHVVQLTDAILQLDDLIVPGFDLIHGLLGDVGVHDDLNKGRDTHTQSAGLHQFSANFLASVFGNLLLGSTTAEIKMILGYN